MHRFLLAFTTILTLATGLIASPSVAQVTNVSNNDRPCEPGPFENPTDPENILDYLFNGQQIINSLDYDMYIGVCRLEGETATLSYSGTASQTNIFPGMSIRSCGRDRSQNFRWGCIEPTPYQVQVQTSGNNFTLESTSGAVIPINLSFSDGGTAVNLQANEWNSGGFVFSGSTGQKPASLNLSLDSPETIAPGIYSNEFFFTLEQQNHCGAQYCSDSTLEPIRFIIELTVAARIRISMLDDLLIPANPAGVSEAQEEFCVFSQGGTPFYIRAQSDSGMDEFIFTPTGDDIHYEPWVGSYPSGNLEELEHNQPSSQSWNGSLVDGCNNSENMRVVIRVQANELSKAQSTSYSDTLTLTVELE